MFLRVPLLCAIERDTKIKNNLACPLFLGGEGGSIKDTDITKAPRLLRGVASIEALRIAFCRHLHDDVALQGRHIRVAAVPGRIFRGVFVGKKDAAPKKSRG